MKQNEIYEKLNEIFRDVFDDETLLLSRNTSASDIEDWDSLAQINIIVNCETSFGLKFNMSDIVDLKNVGDMIDLIERSL